MRQAHCLQHLCRWHWNSCLWHYPVWSSLPAPAWHWHGTVVSQVNSSRYLGIYPDGMLNWSDHIEHLCRNLAPKVGMLRRLKHSLPTESLLTIYQTTVQASIDYCITVWGYAPGSYLDRVQSLQNRAARIITGNYSREVRGIDLVKDIGWFNIRQRRDYFTGLLVFKSLNNMSPVYMADMFTYSNELGTTQDQMSRIVSASLWLISISSHDQFSSMALACGIPCLLKYVMPIVSPHLNSTWNSFCFLSDFTIPTFCADVSYAFPCTFFPFSKGFFSLAYTDYAIVYFASGVLVRGYRKYSVTGLGPITRLPQLQAG